jgi:hypothetical protein
MSGIPRKDLFQRDPEPPGDPARGIHAEKQVEGEAVSVHASQHKTGGSDAVTPGGIGAAPLDHGHIKHNLNATTDPGASDDLGLGYSTSSVWVNISTPKIWQCVTAAEDAADWNQIDASGGNGLNVDTLWAALGDLVYGTGDDSADILSGNTTATKKFLSQTGDGAVSAAPAWSTIVAEAIAAVEAEDTLLLGGNVGIAKSFQLSGDISPAQLTANTNNWDPTGLADASVIRVSTDASRDLTGIVPKSPDDGRALIIHNIGAQNLVLKDASGSSTAANRFALSGDITLGGDDACILQYDTTTNRWRAIGASPTVKAATTAISGISKLASVAQGNAGVNTEVACSPDSIGSPIRTFFLSAQGGAPTTTAPCSIPAKVEAGTNDVDYWVLDFDKDADEYAFWGPPATPDNWDGGTMTAIFYWTTAAGGAAETVRWAIQLAARDDNDPIDDAWGTAVTVNDTWIADGDVHKSSATGNITPDTAGTRAGGDLLFIRVFRDVSGDDLGGDARLLGVRLSYTTEGYSD